MEIVVYITAGLIAVALALLGLVIIRLGRLNNQQEYAELKKQVESTRDLANTLIARQDMLVTTTESALAKLNTAIHDDTVQTEQKLDNMRRAITESMGAMQEGNAKQLENIRKTVDEKLQDTLDKKLNESFRLVSERLEQVYKGLGEMQTLASGVGDLKKVLSNVKTRGTLGEIQLGAILELMLSPEQYAVNVATKSGSRDNVEFAVKLPGDDGGPIWLPIDSKFPIDAYSLLVDAYDSGDIAQVDAAQKALKARVRAFAKDISTKYIDPPGTTDFAIMFLPTEGLYAELVRLGMVESLQGEFKVNIAGPTTMGALLNSLQMGFRTLAIQRRSSEVWKILGNVKSEFETFASVLDSAKNRIRQANDDLDRLVGTRTRQIQRALKDVEALPSGADTAEIAFKQPEDTDV